MYNILNLHFWGTAYIGYHGHSFDTIVYKLEIERSVF